MLATRVCAAVATSSMRTAASAAAAARMACSASFSCASVGSCQPAYMRVHAGQRTMVAHRGRTNCEGLGFRV